MADTSLPNFPTEGDGQSNGKPWTGWASGIHDRVVALPDTYTTQVEAAGFAADPGFNLGPHQLALPRGTGSDWDNIAVESLSPFWDSHSGRWAGVYTGYGTAYGDSAQRGAIGLAFSDNLITWTKTGNRVLQATTNNGDPDQNGASGPVIVEENDIYYLFYIGLTATGYEQGNKTINVATNSLPPTQWTPNNWTRHGTIIAPAGTGWRAQTVWHSSIVKRGSTYYLFFNAGDGSGIESIGYATATSLLGPWTVDDAHSPLIARSGSGWDSAFVGDPCVYRTRNGWVMHYFGVNNTGPTASNGVATTTDAAFPLGWVKSPANPILTPGPAGSIDSLYAHKPIIVQWGGRAYHFYTAVDTNNIRQVGVAVASPKPISIPVVGGNDSAVLDSMLSALTKQGLVSDTTGTVIDSFNRADSSTTLGNADTGQAWTTTGGTWGISNNQAYVASGGGHATIDAGAPIASVSVTLSGTMPTPGQAVGLILRYGSEDVHFALDVQGGGGVELDLFNYGASNVASNSAAGFVGGDTLTVLDDGATLTVQRNGTTVLTYASTIANTATKAGISNYACPGARYDNFRIAVVALPDTYTTQAQSRSNIDAILRSVGSAKIVTPPATLALYGQIGLSAWFWGTSSLGDRFTLDAPTALSYVALAVGGTGNFELAIYATAKNANGSFSQAKMATSGIRPLSDFTPDGQNQIAVPFQDTPTLPPGEYTLSLWADTQNAQFEHGLSNELKIARLGLGSFDESVGGLPEFVSADYPSGRAFIASLIPVSTPAAGTSMLMGDSITASQTWFDTANYHVDRRWTVSNQGSPGETTAQMVARFNSALATNPKLVMIFGGANDVGQGIDPQTTINNLRTMRDQALTTGARVIMATVTPRGFLAGDASPEVGNAAISTINTWLRSQSVANVSLADWHDAMTTGDGVTYNPVYFNDHVHPSVRGQRIMASILAPLL